MPASDAAAEDALRRLLAAEPGRVDAWAKLAELQVRQSDYDGAVFSLAAAIRLAPGNGGLQANLAFVQLAAGQPQDAERAALRALALAPDHPLAPMHLAHARARQGRWSEAGRDYEESTRRLAGLADPWFGVANAQLHAGLRRDAVATLHKAASVVPSRAAELESHALFAMQYGGEFSAAEVFDAHVAWGRHFAGDPIARPVRANPGPKIRVGYVSPSFHTSALVFALLPVLAHHDRGRFEITCYSGGDVHDEITGRMRGLAGEWRDTRAMNDAQLARRIRDDAIDVLVDLAGHTPGNRLTAFALRPAPVQLSWLDYFNTTGVAAMDALVIDEESLRTPLAQSFVERLEAVGPCRYVWEPPAYAPEAIVREGGPVTFASFARLAKVSEASLDAWAAVLRAVEGSRLLMKNDSLDDAAIRAHVTESLARRGIGPQRIEFRGASGHREMLSQYADVDIVLDTFPFTGGITTIEALWMGRPVVCLRGDTLIGRQGAGILAACGHGAWAAGSPQEFVAIASALATDRGVLAGHHASLRETLRRSPLLDHASYTDRLEALFERLLKAVAIPAR